MNIARPHRPAPRRALASAVLAALLASTPTTRAAVQTWVGSTGADLATGANWDTTLAPSSGDSWVFGAPGTAGATLTNTLTSPAFDVAGITFGSAAATAYTLGGNSFTLTGNITNTNTVAVSHTISSAMQIASGAHTLALGGGGNTVALVLSGNLTGSGALSQTGAGSGVTRVTLSGDNSGFTGTFTQDNSNSTRTTIATAASGSASAAWTFKRNVNGGTSLGFSNATLHLGSLSGGGRVRADTDGTVTLSVGALNASTTFSGILQQANATRLLALTKVGSGTLTLSGVNAYTGATTINAGTLALGASNLIADGSNLVLGGGAFATGGFSETLGTLSLNGSSVLDFGSGASALVFANSSALGWTGTLTLSNFDIGVDSLRFGIGATALTPLQLGGISLAGYDAALDANGFVTFTAIPEPSACAALVGAAALCALALRRSRAHRR